MLEVEHARQTTALNREQVGGRKWAEWRLETRAHLRGGGPQVEEPPLDVAALGEERLQLAVDGALAAQRLVQQPVDVVQARQLCDGCRLCIGRSCAGSPGSKLDAAQQHGSL